MLVNEIMTEDPACCTGQTGLQEVAKMMVDNDCGCIPVVDSENSRMPIGMITDRDICCRAVAEGKNPLDLTASDAMTSTVISVTPETKLEDCLNLMEDSQIRRIAVVDGNGALCGIVAQADVAMSAGDHKTAEVVQEVSRATA
ncbi:MAG TPA: CBS domain-containing protein [Pyrinomonadaceae bacterium]|jgi:CBS domain-containing protein|nr:CBS domain-containing protein [Pyrinomonadaceae bacterium]